MSSDEDIVFGGRFVAPGSPGPGDADSEDDIAFAAPVAWPAPEVADSDDDIAFVVPARRHPRPLPQRRRRAPLQIS